MHFEIIRTLVAAAVGAGLLFGVAGIFLYDQFFAERRRRRLVGQVAIIDNTLAEVKNELAALRKKNCGEHEPAKRYKSVSSCSDVDSDFDMHSAIDRQSGVDADDLDEFYDFPDEDDSGVPKSKKADPELVQLFNDVDQLLKGDFEDRKSAHSQLKEYEKQFPDSVELLWRLAKASHVMATAGGMVDAEMKKEHIFEGCSYAQRALDLDNSSCEAHKWFAITVGSKVEFMDLREKVEGGFVFKEHVDKAMNINPKDPMLHHLSGRFKYEIASLSWVERIAAQTVYGKIVSGSFCEALTDFLQAEELSTEPWKENRLFLAKCYISQKKIPNAISWLERGAEIPATLPEDEAAHKEIQTLLANHCDYDNS